MKFLLQTQIGMEKITELELEEKFYGKYSIDYVGYIPHKNGIVQIDWRSDENLDFYNSLNTIEDAFFVLDYVKNINGENGLKEITKQLDIKNIKQSVDFFFDKLNPFDKNKEFRFVTRKKAPNDFRRIDLNNALKDFFFKHISRVKVSDEEGKKEIWSTLIKNRLITTIRLTTKEKRQGYYKLDSVHGSLRPSIAHGMVFVSDIKSKDTVWDPFCGAGTIGCEIVDNFKFGKLILSDLSDEALHASQQNLSRLNNYKKFKGKVSLKNKDFFQSKDFADTIITNLPFGNQYEIDSYFERDFVEQLKSIKNLKQITILYPKLLDIEEFQLTRKFKLQVLGYEAWIGVYKKINY